MTDTSPYPISDADREVFADMAKRSARPYARRPSTEGGGREPEPPLPDTTPPDGRGFTVQQCNAIREAAHDGLSAREIASTLGFINSRNAANAHATGRCQHGSGDVEPINRTYAEYGEVGWQECVHLRLAYALGVSVTEQADETGRSESAVWRHVNGDCSHGVQSE